MSRTTRTRKGDRTIPSVPTEDESAPIMPAISPDALSEPTAPTFETDDLLALANMDPAELAALMEGASMTGALETGAKVEGRITRIEQQVALVDVGGKSEAWIDREEIPDHAVGDSVTAFVIHAGESEVQLSTKLSGAAASAFLEEALATGASVEGRVASSNKGGYEIRIGDTRAFCPRSMMSRHYVEEPSVYVGQTLSFKVLELGDKTIVSHRAVEEEHAEKFATEFWQKVHVGMELEGTVRSIQAFGALSLIHI